MKVLVLGSQGQLGRCLKDQFKNMDYEVVYTGRRQINIEDFEATNDQIVKIAPDIIVNACAYTAVDCAETDINIADLVNHQAVGNLANICLALDCWLVHISTDYVFDGVSSVAYAENDPTNPQSVYGKTKLLGDLVVQSSGCKYLILRSAWVFCEYGNNFLKTMLHLADKNDVVKVVCDQIGCPTYAQDIAMAVVSILPKLHSSSEVIGIYHYGGDQPCSWYGFAEEIFKEAKLLGFKTPTYLHPIKTCDFPTIATRPAYSVLQCSKIGKKFGILASNWRVGIQSSLKNLR